MPKLFTNASLLLSGYLLLSALSLGCGTTTTLSETTPNTTLPDGDTALIARSDSTVAEGGQVESVGSVSMDAGVPDSGNMHVGHDADPVLTHDGMYDGHEDEALPPSVEAGTGDDDATDSQIAVDSAAESDVSSDLSKGQTFVIGNVCVGEGPSRGSAFFEFPAVPGHFTHVHVENFRMSGLCRGISMSFFAYPDPDHPVEYLKSPSEALLEPYLYKGEILELSLELDVHQKIDLTIDCAVGDGWPEIERRACTSFSVTLL